MNCNLNIKELPEITVLVAEDDEVSYAYLEVMLLEENCRVIRTIDGRQTVEQVRNNPTIDIVLMDLRMPVMDGITATAEIRQFNTYIPIIAQTAYIFESDRQEALNVGCNDYLAKPIRRVDFLRTMRKYLCHNTG